MQTGEGERWKDEGEERQEIREGGCRRRSREKGKEGEGSKKTKCTLEKEADGRRGKEPEGRRKKESEERRDTGNKRWWMEGGRNEKKDKRRRMQDWRIRKRDTVREKEWPEGRKDK